MGITDITMADRQQRKLLVDAEASFSNAFKTLSATRRFRDLKAAPELSIAQLEDSPTAVKPS